MKFSRPVVRSLTSSVCALSIVACGGGPEPGPAQPDPLPTTPPPSADAQDDPPLDTSAVPRTAFNKLAAELALPWFWIADDDADNKLAVDELAVLWGVSDLPASHWVDDGEFSDAFATSYAQLAKRHKGGPLKPTGDDAARRLLVLKELSQGRPSLVHWDFSKHSEADKAVARNIMEAASLIEVIHRKQLGSAGLEKKIPEDDPASQMLFYRNQGPWCVAPATENNKACNAIPGAPKQVSGLYPADIQKDPKFCESLKKKPNGKALTHQFHVVTDVKGKLTPVPYTDAYAAEMKAISKKLKATAGMLGDDEKAFRAYLLAAAQSFLDNNWKPADEAWAKMSVNNSKWYLRIGPDEVYFEPCSLKAGFHVSFARINQDSLTWQKKLDPVKNEMEQALAKLAGRPYKAREVSFKLPDFIDIILNAGDSRNAHGATIGQSLPNWGPVANEGRGRTVAMTNLYSDDDSKAETQKQAASLLCAATMDSHYTSDMGPQVMSTVLHEAAHNLGPAHEYKVRGKTAREIFDGPLASTMEELKAQTAALFFADWLVEKKLITEKVAAQAHVRDIVWSFGHISRGMYSNTKKPKPYSQLAAIQFGHLMKAGAITWEEGATAKNGSDKGCYQIHTDKFKASVLKLMKTVAAIKGKGDKKGALKLRAEFVDKPGAVQEHLGRIKERWLRAPKTSFVYSVKL